jgi:hypothetical protein
VNRVDAPAAVNTMERLCLPVCNILDGRWSDLPLLNMCFTLENDWLKTINITLWSGQGLMNVRMHWNLSQADLVPLMVATGGSA